MSNWKQMTNFAFSLPHRPGSLAEFVDRLRTEGLNLMGLWGYSSGEDEPRFSCVPEDVPRFAALMESMGIEAEAGHAFYLNGEDRPGALVETLQRIADTGISLDAIEAVAAGDKFGCFIWAGQDDWDRLEKLLKHL